MFRFFQRIWPFRRLKPPRDDWAARLQALEKDVKALAHKLEKLTGLVELADRGREPAEMLAELQLKVRVIECRSLLAMGTDTEQLHATEIAAQLLDVRAIPLLLSCLRDPKRSPQVLEEALYGLGRHAGQVLKIPKVSKAIDLVVETSQHPAPMVRLAALGTMNKIDPYHERFLARLRECRSQDSDDRVRAAAGDILAASGLDEPAASPASGRGYEVNRARHFRTADLRGYVGQIVAFSRDGCTILGSGADLAALEQVLGERKIDTSEVVLEFIPEDDMLFGGAELQ